MPFDWFGSVLVPVAAVLVSSAIAVWLARSERRATARSELRAEVADLLRLLTDVSVELKDAPTQAVEAVWESGKHRIVRSLQVMLVHLRRRELVVPRFLLLIIAATDDEPQKRVKALDWMVDCLDAWMRGEKKPRHFRAAIPDAPELPPANLDDWKNRTGSSRAEIERWSKPVRS